MSTAPTPPQPIPVPTPVVPPQRPLLARVRDDLIVGTLLVCLLATAFGTTVLTTVYLIDRRERPAVVTPREPVTPARPDRPRPKPPPTPIEPEPPVVTPTPPAPATPLGSAVRDYRDGLAGEFTDLAAQVRSGKIRTSADVAAAARSHAEPMAKAMGKAVADRCDASGNVTDVAGLAKEFDQAAQAMGGK